MRFQEMVSQEDAVIAGNDIEALHDMRVSCRRVQSILKVYRNSFNKKSFKPQYAVIRTLIKSLGRVRECDVFINMLEEHMKSLQGVEEKTLNFLHESYAQQRNSELKELRWTLRLLSQIRYKKNFLYFIKRSF